jgi:pilus assembly protein Flp/PilA
MKTKFIEFLQDEEGATAIEYALIAALIAVAAILAMTGVGKQIEKIFNDIVTALGGTPKE